MAVGNYDPAIVVAAVNALQPLGKLKALEQIESFLGSRHERKHPSGLFWVLRVLFDVPAERGFPPVVMGTPDIPPPADPGTLPRFPILILRDVPFLLVRSYMLMGLPEPVEAHVGYFRNYGTLRERPLAPGSSLDGVEQEFLQLWRAAYGDAYVAHALETITEQCARFAAAPG